jgi:Mrp family chromosome partitioning ATPase
MAAAFVLTMNKKKMYRSWTQLSTGFTVNKDLQLAQENFNLHQIDANFNNTIQSFNSPKVLSLLSYSLMLHDLTSPRPFKDPAKLDFEKHPDMKNINKAEVARFFAGKRDSILILDPSNTKEKWHMDLLELYGYNREELKKTLYVGRYQRTDYIDITFQSENPDMSAFVVNTMVKEFFRYQDAFNREKSQEAMLALDSTVRKRKAELDERLMTRARFLTDSMPSNGMDQGLQLGQVAQYESAQAEELARTQDLQYQLAQINRQLSTMGKGGTATPTTTTSAPGNNVEYFAARRQYNDLYDQYVKGGSSDPEMRKRLDDLRRTMTEKAPTGAGGTAADPYNPNSGRRELLEQQKIAIEGQLKSAMSKSSFYGGKLGSMRSQLNSASPAAAAKLQQLDKDVELATLEYTSAKEQFNKAGDLSEGVNTFKQTIAGQPASEPEPSRRLVVLALSGITVFILSSLIFIFIEYFDQSIKTPSQFQRQTGLKLLGTVNAVNLKGVTLKDHVTHIEKEEAQRDNYFRELLRKLRYEIEHSGKRVILFASTEPRQGKTTLSQALAFSLSLGKKKVLLLDTNFCNNDLTVFNQAQPTLEQFSGNGSLSSSEPFRDFITETGVENVDIIGCKGGDYTPSEILPKNHLLNYIPDLLKSYDYIFMEGAPLNGFTDTKELVQYADGVVAIFSATSVVKQSDKESIKFFHNLNGKFVGAILNKVEESDINL